ncbi:MAG: hypothetical protein DMG14_08965 [Acidobacteria bacterium]|nr:MAG: hypothetical protein DMG14_08965 [Acidobacteriota bacterium]
MLSVSASASEDFPIPSGPFNTMTIVWIIRLNAVAGGLLYFAYRGDGGRPNTKRNPMIDQVGHTDGHASVFTSELLNPQFELPEKPKSRDSNNCNQCDQKASMPTSTAMLWNHTEPEHGEGEEESHDNSQNSPAMVMHFQNQDDQRGQARDAAKIREDHLGVLRLFVSCVQWFTI